MLLPYNVDRPTRAIPTVTYALMAANIFIFLLSVIVANLSLSTDRAAGKEAILALTQKDDLTQRVLRQFDEPSSLDSPGAQNNPGLDAPPQDAADESDFQPEGDFQMLGQMGDDEDEDEMGGFNQDKFRQRRALALASKQIDTPEQYKTFWQIEHANASWVVEPHYSFMNAFAYRANDANPFHQLFSMLTSMFLHADLEHIAGNVLFLWIFGRAAEEFLGLKIYLPIYFFAGIAATLLNHLMTVVFMPQALGIPNLGASGAIAGVLGLFAVRFFRTKVRVFYLAPWAGVVAGIAFGILFFPLLMTLGDPMAAVTVAIIAVVGAMFVFGREWVWGAFRAPSVWVIGAWVLVFNLIPAIFQMIRGNAGGVAYWAHIGGFGLGALYALLIGGVEEGKTEYAIDDAQQSLSVPGGDAALVNATQVLQKEPNNARPRDRRARLRPKTQRRGRDPALPERARTAVEIRRTPRRRAALSQRRADPPATADSPGAAPGFGRTARPKRTVERFGERALPLDRRVRGHARSRDRPAAERADVAAPVRGRGRVTAAVGAVPRQISQLGLAPASPRRAQSGAPGGGLK